MGESPRARPPLKVPLVPAVAGGMACAPSGPCSSLKNAAENRLPIFFTGMSGKSNLELLTGDSDPPSSRHLRAARPFHLIAPTCAQALVTAPCTRSWLEFGAVRRRYGRNIVQSDWPDGLVLQMACLSRSQTRLLPERGCSGTWCQRAKWARMAPVFVLILLIEVWVMSEIVS